ncbi:vacuolar protein 8-like protein [Turdus rufiventris]|nr:vacuolar protein 8-like protein [Turdus rufiventris]
MGQLCGRCMQLLRDFVGFVQRMSSDLVQGIKECLTLISKCFCLKQNSSKNRQLYKPILQPHERVTAQVFLQHIETDFEMSPLGKDALEALRTLSFSENPGLQQSAALYYLHMSQHMNIPLPVEHLEPFYALLSSADLEVQQMSSLSLVNFLLEGNINKELVVQMGLLEPILDLLESEDPTVQCNSCACMMILAVSESNREAIGAARGVTPLLSLAKSYDPRVQQNAVGAILNLTQSEKIQQVLCMEGALPVLALLLESPDSEVQYYSCASLSNVAANVQHHKALLRPGDRFLLRTLISLLSSSVDKCSEPPDLLCFPTPADIQAEMVAENALPKLCSLLASGSEDVRRASIALLWILSQHPPNQARLSQKTKSGSQPYSSQIKFSKIQVLPLANDTLACAELLQSLGMLLAAHKTDPVIVGHTACIIKNLSLSKNRQRITESCCVEGLLQTMLLTDAQEDSLRYVTSCLAELAKQEGAILHMVQWMDEPLTKRLVRLAGQLEYPEPSFHAASIIQHMIGHVPDFSLAFRKSQMAKLLEQVRQQTEETQELLRAAMYHEDS